MIPEGTWHPSLARFCPVYACRQPLELRRHHWRCPGCGLLLPLRFWDPNDWPEED